ncbi:hypothetical protein [Chitinophaga sp. Ak27]|uniref:hypothetical protein n=1 Tax=Chitinophaga sp. Ak27 TaxID=2726116 RepID=UPI00145D9204|nr:hypothetical protein [Chitinophaga sp. Ak27]NLU94892.1 hypothetical protein [Chitinophaga sp. Ak27]
MKILDLHGMTIEVTNIDEAIAQAEKFKAYRYVNYGKGDLSEALYLYWTDLYQKLVNLKQVHDGETKI